MSAETKEEAEKMLKELVNRKLMVGGTIMYGPSHYWWNGEEIDMDYYFIMGFTTRDKVATLEEAYCEVSIEDVPMFSSYSIKANKSFRNFISRYAS